MEKKSLSLPIDKEALNLAKQVDPNAQLVVKARPGINYKLFDNQTAKSFDYVKVMRRGSDLEIRILEQSRALTELPADVVIKDFYALEDVSLLAEEPLAAGADNAASAANGGAVGAAEYVPSFSPNGTQIANLAALPDGMMMVAKPGFATLSSAANTVANTLASAGTSALMSGSTMTYVAAGGGVAAAASAGGGGGGGGSAASGGSATPSPTPQTATAAEQALVALQAAAEANNATTETTTVNLYATAGVTGVTEANLAAVNSALNTDAVDGAATNTVAKIQAIVDAYQVVLNNAAAATSDDAALIANASLANYLVLGVTGVNTTAKANLLGDVIDHKTDADVATVSQIQDLVTAVNAVIQGAAGSAAPTLSQLELLGLIGVTHGNLTEVQQAIENTSNNGSEVDSLSKLQAVVTAALAQKAVSDISSAAANNTANASTTSLATYATAGVTGVTEANVAAVNSALNTNAVDGAATNTVAKIQAIVNAYVAILAEANGPVPDATPDGDPSAAQYALIGASLGAAASDAKGLGLLNDVLGTKATSDVDSVGKINNLAAAVNAVMAAAAGGAAPTKDDLVLLGITGVTDSNLVAVQLAIQNTADDGSGVDTLSELQAVVTTTAAKIQAISDISSAAANNTANASTPSVATYATAGVTGVTEANLAAVNSALNTATVNGEATNTVAKIQAIVNAYQVVLNNAAAATSDDAARIANASQDDYQKIGVSEVDSAVKAALLSDAIDHQATSDVDTVAEIQALANTVAKIMRRAAGGNDAITEEEFATLGIQQLNASRTAALLTALKDLKDNAGTSVDTLAEIQYLVDTTAPTLSADPAPRIDLTGGGNSTDDTISLTLTFDSPVWGLTQGDTRTIFKVNGEGVLASWSGTDGTNTRVLTYTVAAGKNGQATIDEEQLKAALVTYITDAAGNAFIITGDIPDIDSGTNALPVIDTAAPAASWQTPTTPVRNDYIGLTVQSSETGTAYLVKTGGTDAVTVSNLASITSAADTKCNSVAIATAVTATNLSLAGLEDGTYKLYTVDAAGNLSVAASGTVEIDTTQPEVNEKTSGSIAPNSDLFLKFKENVKLGNGSIKIYKTGGGDLVETITVDANSQTPPSQLGINGATVTINPINNFAINSSYYVLVDPGTFTDVAGNAFAGYAQNTDWAFQIVTLGTTIHWSNGAEDGVINNNEKSIASMGGTVSYLGGLRSEVTISSITFHGTKINDSTTTHTLSVNALELPVLNRNGGWTLGTNWFYPSASVLRDGYLYTVTVKLLDSATSTVGEASHTFSTDFTGPVFATDAVSIQTLDSQGTPVLHDLTLGHKVVIRMALDGGTTNWPTGETSNVLKIGGASKAATWNTTENGTLLLTYTIQEGDNGTITIDGSQLKSALSNVKDTAGNLASFASSSSNPFNFSNPSNGVDTKQPTILGFGSSSPNGSYKEGDEITLSMTVSEDLNENTRVWLTLETGDIDRQVQLTRDATSARLLTGRYIVQSGDHSTGLTIKAVTLDNDAMPKDAAGNALNTQMPADSRLFEGSSVKNFIIDTSAPNAPRIVSISDNVDSIIGPVPNLGLSNDDTLTFKVSLEGTGAVAGDALQIYNGNDALGDKVFLNAAHIAVGFIEFTTSQLSNATTYVFNAKVIDVAGNASVSSANHTVTIDTSAPNAPRIESVTDNTGDTTGLVTNGGFSDDTTLVIKISLADTQAKTDDTIQLYRDLTPLGDPVVLTAEDIGRGYLEITSPELADNTSYNFNVKVIDGAGNASPASANHTVTLNTSKPTIVSFTSSAPNGRYQIGSEIALSMWVSDDMTSDSTVDITLETGDLDRTVTLTRDNLNPKLFTGLYTVLAGDESLDLAVQSVTLGSHDQEPKNAAGNKLLSNNLPTGTHSLQGGKDLVIDGVIPKVNSVAITGATGAQNSTLNAGDVVTVTVTFNKSVMVSGGAPSLTLNIGGYTHAATYTSGSGTNQLLFTYTIRAGQTDTDGIGIDANALVLNGSSIKDLSGNLANLSHDLVNANASYKVDTTPPTIVSFTSSSADRTYSLGESIDLSMTVTDDMAPGSTVTVTLETGTVDRQVKLTRSSSNAKLYTGTYVVLAGDTSSDLAITSVTPGTGAENPTDLAGNALSMALPTGSNLFEGNKAIVIDGTVPKVGRVEIVSATGAQNNTLNAGDVVTVEVVFSKSVTVNTPANGTPPSIKLNIGDNNVVYAAYQSGSGSDRLRFTYTIRAGQTDLDGIAINANALVLNGSSIKDNSGNWVDLTHDPVEANQSYKVDTTIPQLNSSLTITSVGAQNDTLNEGDVIKVELVYNEDMFVDTTNGTPLIRLKLGTKTVNALYVPPAQNTPPSNLLSFAYTVVAGDNASRIDIDANSLALNGSKITDAAGNNGSITHASTTSSLKIDTQPPGAPTLIALSGSGISNNTLNIGDVLTVTVTYSEAMQVVTTQGKPQISLNIGGVTKYAEYVSGSGTTALQFNYTIEAGLTDTDGISVPQNALTLNGGVITDLAGHAASLNHTGLANNASYLVDSVKPTLISSSIANGSTNIEVLSNSTNGISLTFSESVTLTDAWSGITIKNTTTGIELDRTYWVNNVTSNSVTLDPNLLASKSNYTITIPEGAFLDTAGNPNVATEINFSTGVLGAPIIEMPISGGLGGTLVAPIKVGTDWYYVWDASGDKVITSDDRYTMNNLETKFGIGNITETNRTKTFTGTVNGVVTTLSLSVPILGAYDGRSNHLLIEGQSWGGLGKIWDTYNGTAGTNQSGVPTDSPSGNHWSPGAYWPNGTYWTSTQLSLSNGQIIEHRTLDLISGFFAQTNDSELGFIVFKVVPA